MQNPLGRPLLWTEPPPCGQTNTRENIALPQTSFAGGNNHFLQRFTNRSADYNTSLITLAETNDAENCWTYLDHEHPLQLLGICIGLGQCEWSLMVRNNYHTTIDWKLNLRCCSNFRVNSSSQWRSGEFSSVKTESVKIYTTGPRHESGTVLVAL